VRQIFPVTAATPEIGRGGESAVAALAGLYAHPSGPRPWLRANMVASADGAGSLDGLTRGLSGPADRLVFSVLRSLADVILVGSGTARDEKYRPVKEREVWAGLREGRLPVPPVAVVTGGSGLDPDSPLLTAPAASRTIVLTTAAAPAGWRAAVAARAEVIVTGRDLVTPAAMVSALAEGGYLRILTEGGPMLLSQISAAGLLGDLCLTYSPVLEGGQAGRILTAAGGSAGPVGGAGLRLAHVLEDDGYLLCRYLLGDG
jgi:riboflavin biosynthesis pyrimidine reductase